MATEPPDCASTSNRSKKDFGVLLSSTIGDALVSLSSSGPPTVEQSPRRCASPSNTLPSSLGMGSFDSADDLEAFLVNQLIDVSGWGKGEAKTCAQLWAEIQSGETQIYTSPLTVRDEIKGGDVEVQPPVRVIRVARVFVCPPLLGAELTGETYCLWNTEQHLRDGRVRQRRSLLTEKIKDGEDPVDGCARGVIEELGGEFPDLRVQPLGGEPVRTFEVAQSQSYPNLKTVYILFSMGCEVHGLPSPPGSFSTVELEHGEAGRDLGPKMTHVWEWRSKSEIDESLLSNQSNAKRRHTQTETLAKAKDVQALLTKLRDRTATPEERSGAAFRLYRLAQQNSANGEAMVNAGALAPLLAAVDEGTTGACALAADDAVVAAATAIILLPAWSNRRTKADGQQVESGSSDSLPPDCVRTILAEKLVVKHLKRKLDSDPAAEPMRLRDFTIAARELASNLANGRDEKRTSALVKEAGPAFVRALNKNDGWEEGPLGESPDEYE